MYWNDSEVRQLKIHYFRTKYLILLGVSLLICKMRKVNSSLVFRFYFQKFMTNSGLERQHQRAKPHLNESKEFLTIFYTDVPYGISFNKKGTKGYRP